MRLQPLDVVGAVPGDAARTAGRREQLALLVEADGVDRDVGAPGQLLDPDLGLDRRWARAPAVPMSGDSRSSCSRGHTDSDSAGPADAKTPPRQPATGADRRGSTPAPSRRGSRPAP